MEETLDAKISECEIKAQLMKRKPDQLSQEEVDCMLCEKKDYKKCPMYVPKVHYTG